MLDPDSTQVSRMANVTLWISLAFALGLIVRHLGLPPLVGYLLAGFGLSALGYNSDIFLDEIAHTGVLLLLFGVGLKLRLSSLFRAEVLAGSIIHMLFSVGIAVLALYLVSGLELKTTLLIALALSFSSTVIAAKVLETKKELRAFHGRVAIGILIMQDIVAVVFLSVSGEQTPSAWALLLFVLPMLRPIFHTILDLSGHDELVILFGLLLAVVIGGGTFGYLGLSSELGALLLGVILSNHPRASELSNALWGLKEIFLVGFFLQIGMYGYPDMETLLAALALCLLLPLKAVLFFFILLMFRLRARSSFLASLTLATYSEFGLILANVATKNGLITNETLILLAVTVAFSFVLAAPINRISHSLYARYEHILIRFESQKRHPDDGPIHLGNSHILIMGMGRVGTGAYDFFTQRNERVLGMDSDPGKVQGHIAKGRRVVYADAEDPGFWFNLNLQGIHAILLALPDQEAKTIAAKQLRKKDFQGIISATALFNDQIQPIQDAGADLVYNYYDEVGFGFAEHVWEELAAQRKPEVTGSNTSS
jgi:predicted Kef-type K+ transport protein